MRRPEKRTGWRAVAGLGEAKMVSRSLVDAGWPLGPATANVGAASAISAMDGQRMNERRMRTSA